MIWNPSLKNEADALLSEITSLPDEKFRAALDAEAYLRGLDFMNGVRAYHTHPYQRNLKDPAAIWAEGGSRLLDYGGPKDAPVLLCVPSLINKAYVLDLKKGRSFMRTMAKKGLRSFLLDWGDVGEAEKKMGLEDYILKRLHNAVEEVHRQTGRPVSLVGYCMGGVLTTAYAAMEPEKIERLVLLATPWDFQAENNPYVKAIQAAKPQLEQLIDYLGELPIDVIQSLFSALDPYRILQKFADFSKLDPDSSEAKKFVALEDWVNDSVPLSGPLAKECLFDWYVENRPARGVWELDGHYIDPKEITCPTRLYIPANDRIVPPESAMALAKLIPNCEVKAVKSGHIGMVTGQNAAKSLYSPLAKWLLSK
ncbi:Poly-beta-hydroxybutyrate polymerase [Candidatus Terasakiella magnetica]|uniref:Poly-beta-hydroxybutyrate polymerase n=1 Tax=Candidatus Terasakiella magnetica TaxID=1867952 RepID=A0A1C3RE95_9PROT|nr:alpha/beta fold hydrolase [Candidatus Terasakiella magnetica]SCA55616.1 Poly-beta-hydroxybutyrate polymerase [Candidatus Terasakiella magnetica]